MCKNLQYYNTGNKAKRNWLLQQPSPFYDTSMTFLNPKKISAAVLLPLQQQDKKLKQERISGFWVAGISYKKADASIRGLFTISNNQYLQILQTAKAAGVPEFFILSTCNRTEIYGLASDADTLIGLLCSQNPDVQADFKKLSYIKCGADAVTHLLQVSAGLDSQILGDYEIVGQIKAAAKISKENGGIGPFMERLLNTALQASKAVKAGTCLSGGTVSVSFAAIQFIRNIPNIADKKILMVGTGKIGRNTCKNLVDYLHTTNITLINRTIEKAQDIANELGLQCAPIQNLAAEANDADIIITSTNSPLPVIYASFFTGSKPRLIIDLSVPYDVDASVKSLDFIRLLNVDELSKMKDETLQKRMAQVPQANAIIAAHVEEFVSWCNMRMHVPALVSLKSKLQQIDISHLGGCPAVLTTVTPDIKEQKIKKVIKTTAVKMRSQERHGCSFIQAINDFMS
jgi:glutamyl-tRNA reductase